MVNIYKSGNGVLFKLTDNPYSTRGQELSFPSNSLTLLIDNSDIATIRSSADNEVMLAARIDEIFINDEDVTKENIQEKWILVATSSQGGGGGTGGAVNSVNGKTGDVVLTASSLNAYTKTQVDSLVETKVDKEAYEVDKATFALKSELPDMAQYVDKTSYKADKQTFALKSEIPSTENFVDKETYETDKATFALKTDIPSLDGYATEEWVESKGYLTEHQDISKLATKEEVTNGLALKVDKSTYDSEKQSFATKSEIADMATQTWVENKGYLTEHQDISKLATKSELTEGLEGKQDKGNYATKEELPNLELYATKSEVTEGLATKQDKGNYATTSQLSTKQDVLKSGTNIKTINGESILGSGNIEIQGGGGGIADAPSDGNKYVRQNGNWVQETTVDTSNLATKEEISDMLTKTEAASTYQVKGEYATTSQLANKVDTSTYTEDKATFALKSELTNFITASVDNLINYYKKSETYTQSEIDAKIGAITTINFEVVAELPQTGEANKIYLVTNAEQSEQNVKDEYIWIENKWELIGSTKIDLSNYYNKGEVDSKLSAKVDLSTYTSDKATFALKSELTDLATKEELELKANTSDLSNYLTTANAETTYAKKSEIPSLDGYLQTSVADEKYATKTELEGKVDDADIADMLTKTEAASTYQQKGEYLTSIPDEYVTETELDGKGYKKIIYITQTEYDELPTKEEGVLYVITDAPEVVIPDTSTFATKEELTSKQDVLESGTNIKTINGETILGSGDIVIEGGGDVTKQYVDEQLALKADKTSLNSYYTKTVSDEKYQPKGKYLQENDVTFTSSSINEDVAQANKIFIKTASTYAGSTDAPIQDDKDVYIGNAGILYQIYKKDTLTKTEASTTYALQEALQAALDRISALETQVGNISAQLDAINGEIIN